MKSAADRRWWREEANSGCVHSVLSKVAEELGEKLRNRHDLDRRHLRFYAGAQVAGIKPSEYVNVLPLSDRVAWNVIASVIDTYVAKMIGATPAPMFLTSGADYEERRKAKKLNKFGKGCLHQCGAYRHGPTIERDAAIFGTAPLFVFSDGKRIKSERVYPWELLVDDVEAFYGEPRTLIRVKYVDRQVLIERFEDDKVKEAIRKAPEADKDAIGRDTMSDQVKVIEAWRLPSGKDAGDGRHAICVTGADLLDEEWTRERFPFAIRRWADPVAGFWGIGIAERLTGIQLEISKLLLRIQEAHHFLGRPIVVLDKTSGIHDTQITNGVAAIVVSNHPGESLRVEASPTMPSDVYAHLMTLRTQAFEEIGVSMLDAAAKKPAGLDSAPSLREYNDIGSERFMLQGKRREEWHLDVVRLALDEAREIPGFSVDVPDDKKKSAERVEWKDVDLEESAYHLQCFPTSLLPQTPAGRTEAIQELAKAGIPQDDLFDLLEIPDLDDWNDTRNAAKNAIREVIDRILDGETYEAPESYDNLELVLALGVPTYLQERTRGAPEDRLSELRRYLSDATRLISELDKAANAMSAPAPMPGAPLPADPLATAMPAAPSQLAAMPPMGTA